MFRVCGISGEWMVTKSDSRSSSSSSTSRAPLAAADPGVTNGSDASTSRPKGCAFAATPRPIRPNPTMPSRFPSSRMIRIPSPSLPQPCVFVARSKKVSRRFQSSIIPITWSETSGMQ